MELVNVWPVFVTIIFLLQRHYAQLKEEFAKMRPHDTDLESGTFTVASPSSKQEASGISTTSMGTPQTKTPPECSASNDLTPPPPAETLPPYLLSNHLSNGSDDVGFDECDALDNDLDTTTDMVLSVGSGTMLAMNGLEEAPFVTLPNSADAGLNSAPSGQSKGVASDNKGDLNEHPGVPLAEVVAQGGHSWQVPTHNWHWQPPSFCGQQPRSNLPCCFWDLF